MSPWAAPQTDGHGDQTVVTRCLYCTEFEYRGTLDEGKEEYADHAKKEHGIVAKEHAIKRKRRSGWSSQKALEENIASARAQGAARWTSDEDE